MSMQQKMKTRGILMLAGFFAVLVVIFLPVFPGKVNGLDYTDNIFNMISKGSSYFIPATLQESELYKGKTVELTVKLADAGQAEQVAGQLVAAGVEVAINGSELAINGDMASITNASLADADLIFNNNGKPLADKYGYSERQVMYNWWSLFKKMTPELNKQKMFAAAKFFGNVEKKALEPAYNYYGVEAIKWQDHIGLILLALAFYVVYTLWYGFGIMYLFEGLGLKISH
ncbi:MAG: hypothetical protein IH612_16575 [Desulfofustis sp.]|nr:hypothetical protein [Desulfofustis sp.]